MEKLNPKNYQKQEKQYMAFGSLMNGCQHIITEKNYQKVAEWAWQFSKEKTSDLLDELYENDTNQDELPL